MLAIGRLRGAHEAQPRVAEGDAVLRVPAAQERARHLARHAADAGARIDPARRHEVHPGLAVALAHEFDGDAADAVGEIVVGRAGDSVRHPPQPQLLEARQELLVMLMAEDAEHPFGRIRGAAARHQREDQAGEVGVVETCCGPHGRGARLCPLGAGVRVLHGRIVRGVPTLIQGMCFPIERPGLDRAGARSRLARHGLPAEKPDRKQAAEKQTECGERTQRPGSV